MAKKVYTLYRISTKGQVEKDDIPMQKEACREFAKRQGWEIIKEFSEKGVSSFKKSAKERDQLQLLQQAAANGEFDILLVFMFDRLGRRDDETSFIVEWFVKQGVEVWSVQEGQQRFDSHVDKLMNYIRYWQASGESVKTLIRTRLRTALSSRKSGIGIAATSMFGIRGSAMDSEHCAEKHHTRNFALSGRMMHGALDFKQKEMPHRQKRYGISWT